MHFGTNMDSSEGEVPTPSRIQQSMYPSTGKAASSMIERENLRLRAEVDELKSRLSLLDSRSKETITGLSNELEQTRKANQDFRSEILTDKQEHSKTRRDLEKLNSDLTKTNRQLQTQIDTFLSFMGTRTVQHVGDLNEAMTIVARLFSEKESSEDKMKYLEGQVAELRSQIEESSDLLQDAESQLKKAHKRIVSYEKAEQPPNPDDVAAAVASEVKRKYTKKILKLTDVIDKQKSEIDVLKNSLQNIKEMQDALPETDNEAELKAVIKLHEAKDIKLKEQIADLETLIMKKDTTIEELVRSNEDLDRTCGALEAELNEANVHIEKYSHELESMKKACKDWKAENAKITALAKSLETELADRETTICDLQLKLSDVRAEDRKSVPLADNKQELLEEENEALKKSIASFEELLVSQTSEIADVHEQRYQLIERLTQLCDFMAKTEAEMERLKHENEELNEENEEMKYEYEAVQKKADESFGIAFDDLKEMVPEDVAENFPTLEDSTKEEAVTALVKLLTDKLKEATQVTKELSESELVAEAQERYAILMMYLQNAYKFLRSMGGSKQEDERTELLTHCARIGKYIEENAIDIPTFSIFEPADLDDPHKVARVFLDFVTDDDLQASPMKELYTLFMCVTQVNRVLAESIEANEAFVKEAQKLTTMEKDERAMVADLEEWRANQMAMNNSLLPIFQQFVDQDCTDYETMVARFTEDFNNGLIPIKEREVLNAHVEDLTNQVEKLQSEIDKMNRKNKRNRERFCKQADEMVEDIEGQFRAEQTNQMNENEELRNQLDTCASQLTDLEAEYKEYQEKVEKNLRKRERQLSAFGEQVNELQAQTSELQSLLGSKTVEANKLGDELGQANDTLKAMATTLEKQIAKKREYKAKLAEEEANNTETLTQLKKRNEELDEKCSACIDRLEQENSQLKTKLTAANDQVNEFNEIKQKLRLENAKIQVQNRTLSLKVDTLTQALEREKESAIAKQAAITGMMKMQNDAQVNNLNSTITLCRELLATLMTRMFGARKVSSSVDQLVDDVYSEMDQREREHAIIQDCLKLRRILSLDDSASVVDIFHDIEKDLASKQEQIESLEAAAKQSKSNEEFLARENAKLEQLKTEMSTWSVWCRSILRQISPTCNANMPMSDIRFVLEEALLTSVGDAKQRRKMETLRAEKKLLVSGRLPPAHSRAKAKPVQSIRPLILATIFAKRLEEMNGQLPMRFTSLKKSEANTPPKPKNNTPVVPFSSD